MSLLHSPPSRMLWFWFHTEGAPRDAKIAGVAFHAASLAIKGSADVIHQPRRTPLPLPRGTYRMAVVRIEFRDAAFTSSQAAQAAGAIAGLVRLTRVPAVQIDFDAPKSAWPFYRDLLKRTRTSIAPEIFLSITLCRPGVEKTRG